MPQPIQITELPVQDAHNLASTGAGTLIDIREPFEWESGSAAGAQRIQMSTLPARYFELPKDQPVLLICASGNRSRMATQFLSELGYDARSVSGGTAAWAAAQLPMDA